MSAPYGNKNAEKWSFRKSVELFHKAIELSNQKETFNIKQGDRALEVTGYKYDFIGEIAQELGTFHQVFDHLVKRFKSLQRLRSQLHSNIETNCYYNAKKGVIKEATGIINLKSNWKWTDRQHQDTNNRNLNVNTELTPEEKKEAINEIKNALNEFNDY